MNLVSWVEEGASVCALIEEKALAEAKSYKMQGIYMGDIMSASLREH